MSAPEDFYEKPSRQNRRQKRSWNKKRRPQQAGLTSFTAAGHDRPCLQTTGNGLGGPDNTGGCVRLPGGLFTSTACCCALSMAGAAGEPQGSPVPVFRSANPARACHPFLAEGSGIKTANTGALHMHTASGTPARILAYRILRRLFSPVTAFRIAFSRREVAR